MSKKATEAKLYDIIPSQDCMYLMYKFGIHKQMAQIPTSFTVKYDLDFELLQKAFDIVIARNDCLRLAFTKKDGELKQYFREPYTYKVPVKYFRSLEQQEEFCQADAPKPVKFTKGEIFRIFFFKTNGSGCGIYSNFTHLVIDAMGIAFFYLDLFQVYAALEQHEPLPKLPDSYESYIIAEHKRLSNERKMAKCEKFYKEYFLKNGEPYYAAVHGSAFLDAYRKKKKDPSIRVPLAYNPLHSKCDFVTMQVSKEDAEKIFDFCNLRQIAPECVLQMGLRTHCSAVNERVDDVSLMSVCSKRATVAEKNMSGCLAQPIQMRTVISEEMTFDEAVQETVDVRNSLYRRSVYPYTKARTMSLDLFGFSPIQGPNSLMFSWIPIPMAGDFGGMFDFRTYNLGHYFTPLYAITMTDPQTGGMKMCYMYRTKLSSKQQIETMHENMMRVVLKGVTNPEIKIGKLIDECEQCNRK